MQKPAKQDILKIPKKGKGSGNPYFNPNTRKGKIRLIELLREKSKRKKYNKINSYFPDEGDLRRELYKKHTAYFTAGATHSERCMLAANRVGKTESVGAYEVTCHLTGIYPEWWDGKRFDKPTSGWAAGDTNQTVRDIIQEKLLGDFEDLGSGMIPKDLILGTTPKAGIPQGIETVRVKHKSGGTSLLGFKSYDQKRKSFQGTKKDFIWEDEEPPILVHTECLLRTMDTSGGNDTGLMICTFTPLEGISETVLHFLPNGDFENIDNKSDKFTIMADWDDVPHISDEQKKALWDSIPVYQREARSKGIPQLGSGVIYPVSEADISVEDFDIPVHWPKMYAMDVGWNNTANVWLAVDRETNTTYLYSCYLKGEAEPVIHAEAIKSRGDWIKGKIDPASRGRSQVDGTQLMQSYIDLGLHLEPAKNAVEAGIYEVWQALSTGKLKVFKSCRQWFEEFRLYRRDEKGKIVKTKDHLMDATRYAVMGKEIASVKPVKREGPIRRGGDSWMG